MILAIPRRTAAALSLSLLAHAAVLAWLVPPATPEQARAVPVTSIQVTLLRLQPPRPATALTPVPAASTARPAKAPTLANAAAAAARPQHAAEPPPVIMPAPQEAIAVAEAPAAAQAAPGFDLQAARGAARAFVKPEGAGAGGADGRGRSMRLTRDEKLGEAIRRSRPADCRNAYAGLGVLAVIPLAASAVSGKGCKW